MIFCPVLILIGCHGYQNVKNHILRNHMKYRTETLKNYYYFFFFYLYSPLQILCFYLDKTFPEIFLELSSIRKMIFCPVLILIGCHRYQNVKNHLLRNHMKYRTKTLKNYFFFFYFYSPLQILCFYCYCSNTLVVMVT